MFFRVTGILIICYDYQAHRIITDPGGQCYCHRRTRSKHVGGENAAACLQDHWKHTPIQGAVGWGHVCFLSTAAKPISCPRAISKGPAQTHPPEPRSHQRLGVGGQGMSRAHQGRVVQAPSGSTGKRRRSAGGPRQGVLVGKAGAAQSRNKVPRAVGVLQQPAQGVLAACT